jgi:ribosomal 50S subunit-associated protein YjgA (DUF615 family)
MNKSILIDTELIDAISHSEKINDKEKMRFLKYIGYLTFSERRELQLLV